MLEDFADAWLRDADPGAPELLPDSLARACASVLAVDGAGLSIISRPSLRLPIGASSAASAAAERWQFTLGDGPCFRAHDTQSVVVAPASVFATQWSVLQQEMRRHAGFRSVVCLPLGRSFAGFGVLDLYFASPSAAATFDPARALALADEVSDVLLAASPVPEGPGEDEPLDATSWLDAPGAQRRRRVWVALGMLNFELRLSSADALAVLRGRAYAQGRSLEELADDMIEGRLRSEQFLPDLGR
ncbi:GAF domain-containing protein [Kineococcus sp. R8]|uniref:ANTAR domain-containing protein n=1 Tax=Kineococcus siccus TaxID=2696567 RepID=UPI001412E18C|nr:ANTAR domain-containing protein [Kineococcus siccus]NAZ80653.1 GAF domain-containing protein [Kineococcus siccus]